jgi:adenosylcobinamide-phosphate synthase
MTPRHLAAAYALDVALGDPEWLPHPVRGFGWLIRRGERALRRIGSRPTEELLAGAALTGAVVSIGWIAGRPAGALWQIALTWTTLATRSLLDESGSVIRALEHGDLAVARSRVGRIVGRDVDGLDEAEIARAVIETLAESACDGIVAPLYWLAVGGLPAAMAYKAVNTLDSMIGHREPPYRYFGSVAARLDDGANFVPARLTALAIAAAACLHGEDGARSLRIWRRDGDKHDSPNAGQSEAAMAGALGVRLGGTNYYEGERHDGPLFHPQGRRPTVRDARAAAAIVATVSAIAFAGAMVAVWWRSRR